MYDVWIEMRTVKLFSTFKFKLFNSSQLKITLTCYKFVFSCHNSSLLRLPLTFLLLLISVPRLLSLHVALFLKVVYSFEVLPASPAFFLFSLEIHWSVWKVKIYAFIPKKYTHTHSIRYFKLFLLGNLCVHRYKKTQEHLLVLKIKKKSHAALKY